MNCLCTEKSFQTLCSRRSPLPLRGGCNWRKARRNDSISRSSPSFCRSACSTSSKTSSICLSACLKDSTICITSFTAWLMAEPSGWAARGAGTAGGNFCLGGAERAGGSGIPAGCATCGVSDSACAGCPATGPAGAGRRRPCPPRCPRRRPPPELFGGAG